MKKTPDGTKVTRMTSPLWKFALRLFTSLMTYALVGVLLHLAIYSYMPDNKALPWLCTASVTALSVCLIYVYSWHFGLRDRNLVKYGHIAFQPWRGAAAGLIACAPFIVLAAVLLALTGPSVQLLYFTLLLLVPIAAAIGYIMGHKMLSVSEKLIYKKARGKDKRLR